MSSDRLGNDGEKVRKFLNNFVGRGNEKFGMCVVGLGIFDEETAGPLANPLDEARVAADALERLDAVERINGAAAGSRIGWLGPLINHGKGKAQFRRDGLGAAFLEHFP